MISTAIDTDRMTDSSDDQTSRTELDSHANMPVVGMHAFVLSSTGKTTTVSAYSPEYEPKTLPIVDAAVQYQCPYSGTDFILVILNAIHVPAMENNLIAPFILRDAGICVKDTPKIQCQFPEEDDHALTFDTTLRIPLQLCGIFSFFPTTKPTIELLQSCEDIYMLTPERFNPHDLAYALNEEAMLDWEGNITDERYRQRFLLSNIEESNEMTTSAIISCNEQAMIDEVIATRDWHVPAISHTEHNDETLNQLIERRNLGMYQASIGSTDAPESEYLMHDEESQDGYLGVESADEEDDLPVEDLYGTIADHLLKIGDTPTLDLDGVMASGTTATRAEGISSRHLAKVWKIDVPTAERTIEITTQLNRRSDHPLLARNYGTGDRML